MFPGGVKYLRTGFTAVLLFFCAYSFSQAQAEYKKKRFTFHIQKPDTFMTFEVYAVNPAVTAKETSSYSWYQDNKILETRGGFSGRLLHGRYVSFYGNKNLRERGIYVKGRKEGKWMKWNSNGKINEITYWRMGIKQGKYVLYNDMGQRMLFAHFKKDKLHGTLVSYEKGQVLSKTKYRNGTEVPLKFSKGKTKDFDKQQRTKSSFKDKFKGIFKKKEKEKDTKPVDDKKKKPVSISKQ